MIARLVDAMVAEGAKARFAAADLSEPAEMEDLVQQAGTRRTVPAE